MLWVTCVREVPVALGACVEMPGCQGALDSQQMLADKRECLGLFKAKEGARRAWMLFTFFTMRSSGSSTMEPTCMQEHPFLH